ncbi:hypothetical protein Sste5346_007087 [Sporothrix stenoceras]|uniref:AB hydrolase-1 domain-containing protein n=1 Tax=Sporothrix stenoceras TaxID=5173 RepID=A0ABR3YWH2_9PEZI
MASASASAPGLYPGEVFETIAGFPTIYHYAPATTTQTPDATPKPLIVCVTGGLHLARVFYGGHAGAAPQDFLAHHLNQRGFGVLSLSYPTESNPPVMPLDAACVHFRVPDWGRQAAETTRRVVEAHSELKHAVVLISWSMGGRMVVPYAMEVRRLGLDVLQYISFAATPGLSSIRPLPPGMVCSPAGYFSVPMHVDAFWGQLKEMASRNGNRDSIPSDIYRREYAGATPIGLIGLGLRYDADTRLYVADEIRHEDDTRVLDVGAYPLPTALYPRSILDPSHALADRATWGFLLTYKLEALIAELGGLAKLRESEAAASRWQKVMDLVHNAPERLSRPMNGNHFFFIGEQSAAETAAAVENLIDDAVALQRELKGFLE